MLLAAGLLAFGCTGEFEPNDPGVPDPTPDPDPDPEPQPEPEPEPEPDPLDSRVQDGLVAIWTFREGAGTTVADRSGVGAPVDLTIQDPAAVTWLPDGGLAINQPTILLAAAPPTKIMETCRNHKLTVEAWVRPNPLAQDGPARILTYSIDTGNRNFMLGHTAQNYIVRVRTLLTNDNGEPATLSAGDPILGPVQHVVFTRDLVGARLYIDGVENGLPEQGGGFDNWDPTYQLAIGNEITLNRPWLGEIFLAAVYCDSLTEAEVQQNLAAGY